MNASPATRDDYLKLKRGLVPLVRRNPTGTQDSMSDYMSDPSLAARERWYDHTNEIDDRHDRVSVLRHSRFSGCPVCASRSPAATARLFANCPFVSGLSRRRSPESPRSCSHRSTFGYRTERVADRVQHRSLERYCRPSKGKDELSDRA